MNEPRLPDNNDKAVTLVVVGFLALICAQGGIAACLFILAFFVAWF